MTPLRGTEEIARELLGKLKKLAEALDAERSKQNELESENEFLREQNLGMSGEITGLRTRLQVAEERALSAQLQGERMRDGLKMIADEGWCGGCPPDAKIAQETLSATPPSDLVGSLRRVEQILKDIATSETDGQTGPITRTDDALMADSALTILKGILT